MESAEASQRLRRITLVSLAMGVSALFLWMIADFVKALMFAIILSAMFHPLYRWCVQRMKGHRGLAAALTISLVVLCVILPLSGFLVLVAEQALHFGQLAGPWVEATFQRASQFDELVEAVPALSVLEPYRGQIVPKLGELAGSIGGWAVGFVTVAARETATLLLFVFVALYAMYFFLLHGRKTLRTLFYHLPLTAEDEQRMVDRFVSVARATIKGTVVIGLIQGVLGGLGLWVAGIGGVALWGTVMAVLSIIPGVGSALVWIPAVVTLGVQGEWAACLGLLIWCVAVVSSVDNVLRPWLVGKDTELPDLVILLSTLGGLTLFGAIGIVLGPIVAALLITVWDMYGTAFRDVLPPPPTSPPTIPPEDLVKYLQDRADESSAPETLR